MASRTAAGRGSRARIWVVLAIVVGLLATAVPLSNAGPVPASTSAHSDSPMTAVAHVPPPRAATRPDGTTNFTLGTVYASTELAPSAPANTPCLTDNLSIFIESSCYPQTQNPSIVHLENGSFGVGYSIYTTLGPLCNATSTTVNLTSATATNVAWAHSLSNASAWSSATLLGTPSCRWPSASEPTFATGIKAAVFGAYILSNQTVNSSGPFGTQPLFPPDWNDPVGDALAFVHSANNGTTWSNVSVVPNVTAAVRPQMAVFGDTVYIVYINTNNSTATYPGGSTLGTFNALSVDLVVSTDSGARWSGPVVLPGLNAAMANWSSAPSIAVNATGAVAVAYATNRTCLTNCFGFYPGPSYGEQIVVAISTHNGTAWRGPTVAGNWTGESYSYSDYSDQVYSNGYAFPWMATPQTAIAYGPTGHAIYVAYAGTIFKSSSYSYLNWEYSGVFVAYSKTNGVTWSNATVAADFSVDNDDDFYSPGIAVSGGTVYIAYVWLNGTNCYSGVGCTQFQGTVSSWVASSTNGANWSSDFAGIASFGNSPNIADEFQGWESSVAISSTGTPVTATTLPGAYSLSYSTGGPPYVYTFDYWTNVSIAYVSTGPTAPVTFVEHNLTAGAVWGISFDGITMTTNQTTIRITNVPLHVAMPVGLLSQSTTAYRTQLVTTLSIPTPYEFSGPTVVDANFTTQYGLQLWIEPTLTSYTEQISMFSGGQFYFIESFSGYTYEGPQFPWYFPANVTETFQLQSDPPFTYWNGSGPGNVTGAGTELNITMGGPVNETGWAGSYGVYTEGFHANGLPSTSTYGFSFDGTNHTSPGANWTYVPNVSTGGYTLSNITANSSTPGWEYFGWASGGSDAVVVPAEPTVELDFALVETSAPVGTVTFDATGIGPGTVWSVEFNGTDYSSSTPSLSVSTRPGTFPWSAGAAVSANGSVGFAPVGVGPTVSVTSGLTINISYTPAYRVSVVAGLGGAASGTGSHWLTPGANATFVAAAANDYAFLGWTGSGVGSYTGSNATANVTVGGAITETASFYPLPASRFNVTFDESGIPSGAWWTVDLNGVGFSSNTSSLTVSNLLSCAAGTAGRYQEAVGIAYDTTLGTTRYVAANPPTQFCTNGGTIQPLTFAPQFEVEVSATLGGAAYVADGGVFSGTSLWAYTSDTVQLSAVPVVGYTLVGWTGTGSGSYTGPEVDPAVIATGPITEVATFAPRTPPPAVTYTVEFSSSVALPPGTTWTVTIGTTSYGGVGQDVNISGLSPGSYTATVSGATSPDGLSRWGPPASTIPLDVSRNATQPVTFGAPSYWVTVGGSSGGTTTPGSAWYVGGASLDLVATPDVGDTFANWTGTGTGSYSGNISTTNATVRGPLTEFATFEPVAPATVSVSSIWSSPSTWALLAAIGLVAGLVIGVAVRRLRAMTGESSGPLGTARRLVSSGSTDGAGAPLGGFP
jgi:hypothetical protein